MICLGVHLPIGALREKNYEIMSICLEEIWNQLVLLDLRPWAKAIRQLFVIFKQNNELILKAYMENLRHMALMRKVPARTREPSQRELQITLTPQQRATQKKNETDSRRKIVLEAISEKPKEEPLVQFTDEEFERSKKNSLVREYNKLQEELLKEIQGNDEMEIAKVELEEFLQKSKNLDIHKVDQNENGLKKHLNDILVGLITKNEEKTQEKIEKITVESIEKRQKSQAKAPEKGKAGQVATRSTKKIVNGSQMGSHVGLESKGELEFRELVLDGSTEKREMAECEAQTLEEVTVVPNEQLYNMIETINDLKMTNKEQKGQINEISLSFRENIMKQKESYESEIKSIKEAQAKAEKEKDKVRIKCIGLQSELDSFKRKLEQIEEINKGQRDLMESKKKENEGQEEIQKKLREEIAMLKMEKEIKRKKEEKEKERLIADDEKSTNGETHGVNQREGKEPSQLEMNEPIPVERKEEKVEHEAELKKIQMRKEENIRKSETAKKIKKGTKGKVKETRKKSGLEATLVQRENHQESPIDAFCQPTTPKLKCVMSKFTQTDGLPIESKLQTPNKKEQRTPSIVPLEPETEERDRESHTSQIIPRPKSKKRQNSLKNKEEKGMAIQIQAKSENDQKTKRNSDLIQKNQSALAKNASSFSENKPMNTFQSFRDGAAKTIAAAVPSQESESTRTITMDKGSRPKPHLTNSFIDEQRVLPKNISDFSMSRANPESQGDLAPIQSPKSKQSLQVSMSRNVFGNSQPAVLNHQIPDAPFNPRTPAKSLQNSKPPASSSPLAEKFNSFLKEFKPANLPYLFGNSQRSPSHKSELQTLIKNYFEEKESATSQIRLAHAANPGTKHKKNMSMPAVVTNTQEREDQEEERKSQADQKQILLQRMFEHLKDRFQYKFDKFVKTFELAFGKDSTQKSEMNSRDLPLVQGFLSFEKFSEIYEKVLVFHEPCGENCKHLKRFYQKVAFVPPSKAQKAIYLLKSNYLYRPPLSNANSVLAYLSFS